MNFFIPWTEESGGLQSLGLQRVGHDWETKKQQKLWTVEWNQTATWAQDHTQVSREGICVDVCVCDRERKNILKKHYYQYMKWINTEQSLRWYLKEINLRFSRINQDDILSENVETFYQFSTKITQLM